MPILRSWQVHAPQDWTAEQREEYAHDTAICLASAMQPVLSIVGAHNSVNIMLAVIKGLCLSDPASIDAIIDSVLDWCGDVAKFAPETKRTLN